MKHRQKKPTSKCKKITEIFTEKYRKTLFKHLIKISVDSQSQSF